MRVYIAGPITGYADQNQAAFRTAAQHLMNLGHVPVNPAGARPGCTTWQDYMRASMHDIAGVDAVCLLPGWQDSKGARFEALIAEALDLDCRELKDW